MQVFANMQWSNTTEQRALQSRGHYRAEGTTEQRALQSRGHYRAEGTTEQRALRDYLCTVLGWSDVSRQNSGE